MLQRRPQLFCSVVRSCRRVKERRRAAALICFSESPLGSIPVGLFCEESVQATRLFLEQRQRGLRR